MEGAIHQSTANTMPETQVDALMSQVADEHGKSKIINTNITHLLFH